MANMSQQETIVKQIDADTLRNSRDSDSFQPSRRSWARMRASPSPSTDGLLLRGWATSIRG